MDRALEGFSLVRLEGTDPPGRRCPRWAVGTMLLPLLVLNKAAMAVNKDKGSNSKEEKGGKVCLVSRVGVRMRMGLFLRMGDWA